jgi:flagellar biosynthesis protein FlhB
METTTLLVEEDAIQTTLSSLSIFNLHNVSLAINPVTPTSEIGRIYGNMFLSTLISSMVLHSIGALILFIRLRKHSYSLWLLGAMLLAGLLTPAIVGSISNALIASILFFSMRIDLPYWFLVLIGVCQTLIVVGMGFLKIIQTL